MDRDRLGVFDDVLEIGLTPFKRNEEEVYNQNRGSLACVLLSNGLLSKVLPFPYTNQFARWEDISMQHPRSAPPLLRLCLALVQLHHTCPIASFQP
jgi:hypothetical protein